MTQRAIANSGDDPGVERHCRIGRSGRGECEFTNYEPGRVELCGQVCLRAPSGGRSSGKLCTVIGAWKSAVTEFEIEAPLEHCRDPEDPARPWTEVCTLEFIDGDPVFRKREPRPCTPVSSDR
jgi:hypothetical protein